MGKQSKSREPLKQPLWGFFLRAKVADVYANEAQETMQASRLSAFDWRSILRASRQSSRRWSGQRVWTRLQQPLAKGKEAVLGKAPSLRRMWTGRNINLGSRGRSYQATPGRSGAVLGREELATALQKVSRSKDATRRSASTLYFLKSHTEILVINYI